MIKLRPYQEEVARAILDSVMNRKGYMSSIVALMIQRNIIPELRCARRN